MLVVGCRLVSLSLKELRCIHRQKWVFLRPTVVVWIRMAPSEWLTSREQHCLKGLRLFCLFVFWDGISQCNLVVLKLTEICLPSECLKACDSTLCQHLDFKVMLYVVFYYLYIWDLCLSSCFDTVICCSAGCPCSPSPCLCLLRGVCRYSWLTSELC